MKQIPVCEDNPWEAVGTNVEGTQHVASAAIEAGVERAVFLSTDKAASPNTHYGACKLVAERLWVRSNTYAAGTRTKLSATRYGNVIGSRGSVIPYFRAQAEAGGPLTVTDPRMTRFWMRLEEAVGLVELALSEGVGGEVFVPKVRATDILTVAEAVAPGVEWVETGIRRGEKLHETLITEDEARDAHDYGTHYRIEPGVSGDPLPDGFVLRSDLVPQMSAEEMRRLIDG
jgi:UDP-N-acetylglucosamine 4,6-dehydratase